MTCSPLIIHNNNHHFNNDRASGNPTRPRESKTSLRIFRQNIEQTDQSSEQEQTKNEQRLGGGRERERQKQNRKKS